MDDLSPRQRMKFDLPEAYTRAIRIRAGLDGVDYRDVIVAALDVYLPDELVMARKRIVDGPAIEPPQSPAARKKRKE